METNETKWARRIGFAFGLLVAIIFFIAIALVGVKFLWDLAEWSAG